MILGVDCDQVLVDTGAAWLAWLNKKSGKNLSIQDCRYDYNLTKYFPELSDPYAFFEGDVYDSLDSCILPDSKQVLKRLSEQFEIVVVSHVIRDHFESKQRFIQRNFPMVNAFVATDKKHFVDVDVMIDDRCCYLKHFNPQSTYRILFQTDYIQKDGMVGLDAIAADWNHVEVLLCS